MIGKTDRQGSGMRFTGLRHEGGITLVELLVVILIIGILAAIAIPSFLNQQSKAHDVQAKSAARTAAIAMETYSVDHQGSYVDADRPALEQIEPTLRDATLVVDSFPNTRDSYQLHTRSNSATPVTFTVQRFSSGTTTRTCGPVSTGGCGAAGSW
jgi:type IV pilus assembly protein PilA